MIDTNAGHLHERISNDFPVINKEMGRVDLVVDISFLKYCGDNIKSSYSESMSPFGNYVTWFISIS